MESHGGIRIKKIFKLKTLMAENTNSSKSEIYEINPVILNSQLGYSSCIDDDNIMVVAHLFGEGFNRNNEKIRVIREEGFVLINGERSPSGKFENLTDNQLYQLVTAGVVMLNDKQRNDFRKKFFSNNDIKAERKNNK